MQRFDVCNGDADGLCAVVQWRLAHPAEAVLVTGLKREIALLQQLVELCYTESTVEILHDGKRVALHRRGYERGRHTTVAEHLPQGHQEHLKWSAERLLQWAGTIGPMTEALADRILVSHAHPEQGYRSCLGLLRLSKQYGKERLEAACQRALWTGAVYYRSVKNIL